MEAQSSEQSSLRSPIGMDRLIEDVPFQVYADSEGMNASGLKDILRSPAHFFEHRFNRVDEKETEALLFGKLFHYAVLEPKLFREKHVVEPVFEGYTLDGKLSTRSKEAQQKKAEWWGKLSDDAIVVRSEWVEKLLKMSDKILNHKTASKILTQGVRETTMWWIDSQTGELCKMRPDFVSERFGLVDLKTTMDAREEAFQYQVRKLEYDLQGAHYCSGAKTSGVCRSDAFTFIAIEKDPPYEIGVWPAGASILARGERLRERGMALYSKCRKTNKWPGYNQDARMLEHPDWVMANELYQDEE